MRRGRQKKQAPEGYKWVPGTGQKYAISRAGRLISEEKGEWFFLEECGTDGIVDLNGTVYDVRITIEKLFHRHVGRYMKVGDRYPDEFDDWIELDEFTIPHRALKKIEERLDAVAKDCAEPTVRLCQ